MWRELKLTIRTYRQLALTYLTPILCPPKVTYPNIKLNTSKTTCLHDYTWNRGVTIGSIIHMVELVEFIKFILCAGFQSVNSVRCAGGVKLE